MKPNLVVRVVFVLFLATPLPAFAQSAAQPGQVLLEDDLADPGAGVLPASSDQPDVYASGYIDGEYSISTLDPTHTGGPTVWLPGQYADTTVSIDAHLVGDPAGRA